MNLISSHKRPIQTAVTKRVHTKSFASVLRFARFKTKVMTFSTRFDRIFEALRNFTSASRRLTYVRINAVVT
jgi:hypothetical protein